MTDHMIPKLAAEAAIDIDDNRRIWMTGYAENVHPDDVEKVSAALQESVAAQALAAHAVVCPPAKTAEQVLEAARAASGEERRPRPDDPSSMRTFGEDDDPS